MGGRKDRQLAEGREVSHHGAWVSTKQVMLCFCAWLVFNFFLVFLGLGWASSALPSQSATPSSGEGRVSDTGSLSGSLDAWLPRVSRIQETASFSEAELAPVCLLK